MTNQVEQEAIRLRQEHAHIAGELQPKASLARERLQNPGKIRKVAASIASYVVPAQNALEAGMVVTVGPKLYHEVNQLQDAYDANIKASAAHLDENHDAYLEMAQADATAATRPASPAAK